MSVKGLIQAIHWLTYFPTRRHCLITWPLKSFIVFKLGKFFHVSDRGSQPSIINESGEISSEDELYFEFKCMKKIWFQLNTSFLSKDIQIKVTLGQCQTHSTYQVHSPVSYGEYHLSINRIKQHHTMSLCRAPVHVTSWERFRIPRFSPCRILHGDNPGMWDLSHDATRRGVSRSGMARCC